MHGDDFCRRLNTEQPEVKVLMVAAAGPLEALLAAGGDVVSAEQLLEKVWDANTDPFTNTVRMTVMKLRRKLGAPQPIQTVPGAGYRL